ncbi:hypothetical protein TD95_001410 [Thielaviopsis punctulata]|uniref:LysM domain-containing protein n=1 Tax=Thielaviopsis punctulata TaxID=72032 RepID=A0A0F4Z7R0_9PEZI|nr:hypothetical protein TD95_001410 [Thielaviopsis punctulata]
MRPPSQRPTASASSRSADPNPHSSPTTMRGTARMPDRNHNSASPRRTASSTRPSTHISSFRTAAAASSSSSSTPSNRSKSLGVSSGSFLGDSWASMTDFASSLFSSSPLDGRDRTRSSTAAAAASSNGAFRSRSQNPHSAPQNRLKQRPAIPSAWGPEPPADTRPRAGRSRQTIDDVAAGSRAEINAALTAARRASVLESYDGVNGGLDISGKSRYKRRNSDDVAAPDADADDVQDQLVYIHNVVPADTMAGLVLKYHCREDVLKKANGMWSNDVQLRKRLFIPVDMCQVKGKACPAPLDAEGSNSKPDSYSSQQDEIDDFFAPRPPPSGFPSGSDAKPHNDPDKPWQHVRWVALESFSAPTEIGRMSKKALGYFPPRRKKSSRLSTSTRSSPRQSLESAFSPAVSEAGDHRANGASVGATGHERLAATTGGHVRGQSSDEVLPAWMRKAGGVGSLSVRAPGPANDILNAWAKKHIPGLSMEAVPSMAIMGTETASIGIPRDLSGTLAAGAPASTAAAGSSSSGLLSDEALARSLQSAGTSLDRMASAMETWVRGAIAKAEAASSPLALRGGGGGGRAGGLDGAPDLIELGDNMSDDGQPPVFTLALETGVGAASGFVMGDGVEGSGSGSGSGMGRGGMRARKGGKSD